MAHFLFGVSAKHLREDVSTTVSQKATTGSATLMSGGRERGREGEGEGGAGGQRQNNEEHQEGKVDFTPWLPPAAPQLTYLRVHLPEVVHDTVQVELPSAKDNVLTRLLHLQ